jgi:hypothetical protein
MSQDEIDKLVQQATIVSTMMLALSRAFHGDYQRKHPGAAWEEYLVAFALWHTDTVANPMTIADIVKTLGNVPRSNIDRALDALLVSGLVCRSKRRYARNIGFISRRLDSPFFVDIRVAVVTAGRELETVFN